MSIMPQSGPVTGQTLVTVMGSQFAFTGEIAVYFGDHNVSGTFVDSHRIVCSTAPQSLNGSVPVTVALNGQQQTASSTSFVFYSMIPLLLRL